jgi:hypothetical protein
MDTFIDGPHAACGTRATSRAFWPAAGDFQITRNKGCEQNRGLDVAQMIRSMLSWISSFRWL